MEQQSRNIKYLRLQNLSLCLCNYTSVPFKQCLLSTLIPPPCKINFLESLILIFSCIFFIGMTHFEKPVFSYFSTISLQANTKREGIVYPPWNVFLKDTKLAPIQFLIGTLTSVKTLKNPV